LSCRAYRFLCFFFSPLRDLRDLHSFPTRRSSDLGIGRGHVHHTAVPADQPGRTGRRADRRHRLFLSDTAKGGSDEHQRLVPAAEDRKSTRLNSSHSQISYAVFCLKKKRKRLTNPI